MARYELVNESASAHCCFKYSIIDTMNPHCNKFDGTFINFETVCEFFDLAYAEATLKALNEVAADLEFPNAY